MPNTSFGGTEQEGLELLQELHVQGRKVYVPVRNMDRSNMDVEEHKAMLDIQEALLNVSDEIAIRQQLQTCKPTVLAFFEQRSPVWYIARQQRPLTASALFDLLLLPALLPEQHRVIASPQYRRGMQQVYSPQQQPIMCTWKLRSRNLPC